MAAVKHKVGGSAMMLSKGVGVRAGGKPVSMYQRRPGWTLGENWPLTTSRSTELTEATVLPLAAVPPGRRCQGLVRPKRARHGGVPPHLRRRELVEELRP